MSLDWQPEVCAEGLALGGRHRQALLATVHCGIARS